MEKYRLCNEIKIFLFDIKREISRTAPAPKKSASIFIIVCVSFDRRRSSLIDLATTSVARALIRFYLLQRRCGKCETNFSFRIIYLFFALHFWKMIFSFLSLMFVCVCQQMMNLPLYIYSDGPPLRIFLFFSQAQYFVLNFCFCFFFSFFKNLELVICTYGWGPHSTHLSSILNFFFTYKIKFIFVLTKFSRVKIVSTRQNEKKKFVFDAQQNESKNRTKWKKK